MKITVSALAPLVRAASRDLVGIAGVAMIIAGVRQIYAPAGLIVAGACLVYGAIQHARRF